MPRVPPRRGRTGPRPNTHLKSQTLATPVGANTAALGKTVNIDGKPYTMIGVIGPQRGNFPCPPICGSLGIVSERKSARSVNPCMWSRG